MATIPVDSYRAASLEEQHTTLYDLRVWVETLERELTDLVRTREYQLPECVQIGTLHLTSQREVRVALDLVRADRPRSPNKSYDND